jgi:hypothetical protein
LIFGFIFDIIKFMSQKGERSSLVLGVGPGSIAALEKLAPENTTVIQRRPGRWPKRSTYTLVRGYQDLFKTHVPESMRLPLNQIRFITDQGTDFTHPSGNDYCMVDFPAVMGLWTKKVTERFPNLVTLPDYVAPRDVTAVEKDGGTTVYVLGTPFAADSVIDATGNQALIASKVEPRRRGENPLVEYVCGGTYRGEVPDGQMILVFGPGGGATSWVNRSVYSTDSEPLVDICLSGWGPRSHFFEFKYGDGEKRLRSLVRFMNQVPDIHVDERAQDIYCGYIRSEKTPLPQSGTVFAVGEAGGVGRPFLGESFNRSMQSGDIAAKQILNGGTPADYHREFYSSRKGENILFRMAVNRVGQQQQGQGMRIVDELATWQEKELRNPEMVRGIERLLIEGRISPLILVRALTNPTLLNTLLHISKNVAVAKLRPSTRYDPNTYPYPQLIDIPD